MFSSVPIDKTKGNIDEKKSNQLAMPWVEKYRPTTVENIIAHVDVVSTLKKCLVNNDSEGFPNLLFYGSPGTGKTSTIIAACKQMFEELYSSRVLELNASDERGIQVVREKIKSFAQLTASSHKLKSGRNCPSFKVIILDEADAMTTFAQSALRRTMETESRTTRFCLICNYVSKIIDPVLSRCMKFRFRELPRESVFQQLTYICSNENITINKDALEFLVDHTNGDLRKAINILQSSKRMVADSRAQNAIQGEAIIPIKLEDLQESSGIIPSQYLESLVSCIYKPINDLQKTVKKFLKTGYSVRQMIEQVQTYLLNDSNDIFTGREEHLTYALEKLAIVDKRLMDGASEYIEMLDLFSSISSFVKC